MRKLSLLSVLLLCFYWVSAQDSLPSADTAISDDSATRDSTVQSSTAMEIPRNEVNYNILNTLLVASVELGYEYFIGYDQSVGAKVSINDRPSYRNESHSKKFKTNSVSIDYTYYFGKENPGSEFYVQPFVKYRFGDFEEYRGEQRVKTDMNDFMVGFGAGYIWNFSNSFVIGPFVNVARGFSSDVKDRFSTMEFNAGVNLGYRF